jgi:hypothetical protein
MLHERIAPEPQMTLISRRRALQGLGAASLAAPFAGFTAFALTREKLRVAYRDWQRQELDVVEIARPT